MKERDRLQDLLAKAYANSHRQCSCGCCAAGCVCFMHRDVPRGVPQQVCAYHQEHPHTRTTEPRLKLTIEKKGERNGSLA